MRLWKAGLAVGACMGACAATSILPSLLAGSALAGAGLAWQNELGWVAVGLLGLAGFMLRRRRAASAECRCHSQCDIAAPRLAASEAAATSPRPISAAQD
jgi:uncharacterized membrane protein